MFLQGVLSLQVLLLSSFSQGLSKHDCDFSSNMCEYEIRGNRHPKWDIYDSSSKENNGILTYSDLSSPFMKGSFLYVAMTNSKISSSDTSTVLVGPFHQFGGKKCISFKYRMFGPHPGRLKVSLKAAGSYNERTLLYKRGNQGEAWQEVTLSVEWRSGQRLHFTGYHRDDKAESKSRGELALDDIQVRDGECPEIESNSCSFDVSPCGWGDFDGQWQYVDSSTTVSPGPQFDATTGDSEHRGKGGFGLKILEDNQNLRYTLSPGEKRIPKGHYKCFRFRYSLGEGASLQAGMRVQKRREFSWTSEQAVPRGKWLLGETTVHSDIADSNLVLQASKLPGNYKTYVAIDDLHVSDDVCPLRGNSYFEDGFGLYSNAKDLDFDWLVTSSETFPGIDIKDHTYETKTGHYALANFEGESEGNKAWLLSPIFHRDVLSCLEFSFHVSSQKAGTLTVSVSGDKKWYSLGSTDSTHADSGVWHSVILPLELKEDIVQHQIVFEATVGSEGSGYIALDDIILSDTSCIAKGHHIDWSSTGSKHLPSPFDCSFENMAPCKWKQMTGSDFDLRVAQIGVEPNDWDPKTNHAGEDDPGSVLGTDSVKQEVGRGGLTSPKITENSNGHCLSFWYWLRGNGVSLKVFRDKTLLWQRTLDEGRGWQWAEISMSNGDEVQYNVLMEKLSSEGSVQIDDLWYSPSSCQTRLMSLKNTCDLETGLCSLTEPSTSNDSWTLVSGDWSGAVTWDQGDSTYKTSQGHFLLYSQEKTVPGSLAILESPLLTLQPGLDTAPETCVHFQYFLSGPDVGTLEVATDSTHSFEDEVWKTSGDHGPYWLPGEIQLGYHTSSEMKFEFKAIAGTGPKGLFGIDDIAVRQGRCSSPGSCGFDNLNYCTWRPDPSKESWEIFQANSLSFLGDKGEKATLISEQFFGGQVRCIHFVWAHVGPGKGSLELARRDAGLQEDNQIMWALTMEDSDETIDSFTWRPARVSVEAKSNHMIYMTAEASSDDFRVLIDNILITNQPCKAEPAEAVSFNCYFSDVICYWYQESDERAYWNLVKGRPKSGPKVFAQIIPLGNVKNSVARLYSPVIPAGDRCVRFSHSRHGADVGYLKVFMDVGHKRLPYVDWRGTNEKDTWEQTAINLRNDQNYRLVFEGMCNADVVTCFIAIDEIEISDSGCPDTWHRDSDSPHCTFESDDDPLCQFSARPSLGHNSFTWKREGGLAKSHPNAPKLDFTLGASGYYAYVAPPIFAVASPLTNVTTTLISPTLHSRKDAPYCMIFAYYMESSRSSELRVYQVVPGEDPNTPLLQIGVSDDVWEKAFVTLDKLDVFHIIFEATADATTTRGLAVDEIFLKKGPCIRWSDLCSFTDDFCLWTNVVDGTDIFDWDRRIHELTVDDGPMADHTQRGLNGHYLGSGRLSGNKGDNAKLQSEMHFPTKDVTDMCVDFVYFMSGKGSAVLNVNLLSGFETAFTPTSLSLWSLETSQTQRGEWLRARVPVEKRYTSQLLKIEFEVILNSGGVSIDDIHIQPMKCTIFPEEAKTSESVLDSASCSFDEGSLCGWHNPLSDSPQWILQRWSEVDRSIPRRSTKEMDVGGSLVYTNTARGGATGGIKSVLTSPLLLPTDGVNCLRFWFYTAYSVVDTLKLTMDTNDTNVLLWHGDVANTWRKVYVNIYNEDSFQLSFETELGAHAIEDIFLTTGSCPRTSTCGFVRGWCGYTQDTSDDFDWEITTAGSSYSYGIQPSVQGHSGEEKARLISPVYAGGGPQCFEFSIQRPAPLSGQLFVYAQELGSLDPGENLWEMPYVKTLDVTLKRLVQVDVHKAKPFRLVLEFKVGISNGNSPTLDDLRLLSHPCQPQGSCDFEDGLCSYTAIESKGRKWGRETPDKWNSQRKPLIDHTFFSRVGYYMSTAAKSSKDAYLDLESTILPRTSNSCLTFAYSLLKSAHLQVVLNVDDSESQTVLNLTDSFDQEHSMDWKEIQVSIQADRHFILVFRSFKKANGGDSYVTASLDDIQLMPGSCDEQTTTAPATTQPDYHLIADLSCSFESTSRPFCQYNPGTQSNGYWRRTYGSYNSSGLGFDHTRGDTKGVYASLVSLSETEPAVARLEVLTTLTETAYCLSFWYHIAGNSANTLSVYTAGDSPAWVKSNEQDLIWQQAQIVMDLHGQDSSDQDNADPVAFHSIKFEGVILDKDGHVALDDIEFFRGSCPSTKKDTGLCEFEQDGVCEYTQDSHDANHWQRKQAGRILTSDGSFVSEPYYHIDHTYGTSKGHFMVCCAAPGLEGSTSSLISPVYKANPDGRCLVFWYKRDRGDLIILMRDREGHTERLEKIYVKKTDWAIQHYNIRSRSDFQIIFQTEYTALYRSPPSVAVILDDIQVSPGPCHELYGCDFSRDFCSWTQDVRGNAEWRITSGVPPPGKALIGPERDHSTNSAAGQYIILQGSREGYHEDITTLTSQVIFLPGGHETGQSICFSFWYHMSDSSAGSIRVEAMGTDHAWGPFNHEEAGWVHEMMSVPLRTNSDNLQISLVASVAPGRANYIALDDLELQGFPCQKVEHTRELSCKDGVNTKVSYDKVCDFVSDCNTGQDERYCSDCDFEESWCRFVSIMDDQNGWQRMSTTSDSILASGANGYFIGAGGVRYKSESFESSTNFKKSSPSCRVQFRLNLVGDIDNAPTLTIKARTHYGSIRIFEFESPSAGWTTVDILVGNIGVPFQLVFESWTNADTDAIGFDDFKMIDCAFPEPQAACSIGEFRCDNQACVANYKVCDFSNDCGDFSDERNCGKVMRNDFNVNFGQWILDDTSKDQWILGSPYTHALKSDHTPGSGGMYCFTEHESHVKFDQDGKSSARMESPIIAATDSNTEACQLSFFFAIDDELHKRRIVYNADNHNINVYTKSVGSHQPKLIVFTTQQIGQWTRAVATLSESQDFQVIIEGVTTEEMYKDKTFIALDDISFSPSCRGSTAPLPSCAADEFRCDNQGCIESYKVCDFTSDCSDLSDEKGCDTSLCTDFQYGYGGWDSARNFGKPAWFLRSAARDSIPKDHTPDVYRKQYSFVSHLGPRTSTADKTSVSMSSPLLWATDSDKGVCEFGFFYWIRDTEHYKINVYTQPANSGRKQISYTSVPEGEWTRAVAQLSESVNFNVIIEAVDMQPSSSDDTNVAIDDIYFTHFCQRKKAGSKKTKTQSTTQSGAMTTSPTAPVDETTPPIDETTPSIDETTPPIDENTTSIDKKTPPIDETTPPIDEKTPSIDETTTPIDRAKTYTTKRTNDREIPQHSKDTEPILRVTKPTLEESDFAQPTRKPYNFYRPKHDEDDLSTGTVEFQNKEKKQENKNAPIWIGVSVGLIALGLGVLVAAIVIRRYRPTLLVQSNEPREVGFDNQLYNEHALEEVPEVGYGSADQGSRSKPRSRSIENPVYQESSAA